MHLIPPTSGLTRRRWRRRAPLDREFVSLRLSPLTSRRRDRDRKFASYCKFRVADCFGLGSEAVRKGALLDSDGELDSVRLSPLTSGLARRRRWRRGKPSTGNVATGREPAGIEGPPIIVGICGCSGGLTERTVLQIGTELSELEWRPQQSVSRIAERGGGNASALLLRIPSFRNLEGGEPLAIPFW